MRLGYLLLLTWPLRVDAADRVLVISPMHRFAVFRVKALARSAIRERGQACNRRHRPNHQP